MPKAAALLFFFSFNFRSIAAMGTLIINANAPPKINGENKLNNDPIAPVTTLK